jgi:photosystem II stability/assembly factor-like uncharacterized protein
VQQMTSQVLNAASLLKTTDGGLTWQSYELPTAGVVSFNSTVDGLLLGSVSDQLFHTTDGGLTWNPANLRASPLSVSTYPDGKTLSGWQTSSTGWAATSQGDCTGDKSTLGFTCQVNHLLWQTLDGGQNWSAVPLPINKPVKR